MRSTALRLFIAFLITFGVGAGLLRCAPRRAPSQIPNQPTGGCNTNDPACANMQSGKNQGEMLNAYRAEQNRIKNQTVIKTTCKLFEQRAPCGREWFLVSTFNGELILRERGPELILSVKMPIDVVILRDRDKQSRKIFGVTAGKTFDVEFD